MMIVQEGKIDFFLHNILVVPLKNRATMKLGLMVAKLQVEENMVSKLYETPGPT